MKAQIVFKRLSMVLAAILLVVVFIASGELTAYAAGASFSNHWLSSGGGVKASYNSNTKVLTISGAGTVEFNRWKTMAQMINAEYYSEDVYSWSESINEEDMDIVFNGAEKAIKLCGTVDYNGLFTFFSGDIDFNGAVDLSPSATNLYAMFAGATKFNEPVDFDTSNITNMKSMFYKATSFNQPVNFDTSNVTNMQSVFYEATSFNRPVKFDTISVTDMYAMFSHATSFNQPIDFDIGAVRDVSFMFYNSAVRCVKLNNSATNLNVYANNIFKDCTNLKELQFSGLKNAAIDGFSDDYQVIINGGTPIYKSADQPYAFAANQNYLVCLQPFSDFPLSSDGGVTADYDFVTKVLDISGAGTIEYNRWKAMAQKIDPRYYKGFYSSWRYSISEDDMDIVFNGAAKAIKLFGCTHDNGIFMNFSGDIDFNGAVALAPSATDIRGMFLRAKKFNEPVDFDTSNVTNMGGMFFGAVAFNQPVNFDTSNVTSMYNMFNGATSFNRPVNFDTSNVTVIGGMFDGASSFNQPVAFDTGNVENMEAMFSGATSFNQPVAFDTGNVENMEAMFSGATSFNQPVNFDTSNVANMGDMFSGATSFNQPVAFDTGSVENMDSMFSGATSFNQSVEFNIGSVRYMLSMFENSAVEQVKLNNSPSNADVEAADIFKGCAYLAELQFSGLKDASIEGFSGDYYIVANGGSPIPKAADQSYNFNDNQNYHLYLQPISDFPLSSGGGVTADYDFTTKVLAVSGAGTIEFDKWVELAQKIHPDNFGQATSWNPDKSEDDMQIVFNGAEKAIKLCGSGGANESWGLFQYFSGEIHFNDAVDLAPTATSLRNMFCAATQFNEPLEWDTFNVTDMSGMFNGATAFNRPLDWETENVTDMSDMFAGATSFNQPLAFETTGVTKMVAMFKNATAFNQPIRLDTESVTDFTDMFNGTVAFNQRLNLSIYSANTIERAFSDSAVKSIVLNNSDANQFVNADEAFKGCLNLEHLEFRGLIDAAIDGFGDYYYVFENGEQAASHGASFPFSFNDGQSYVVHLLEFLDFPLSSGGGVQAEYDFATKVLRIYGAGTVEFDRWSEMAQKIHPNYFGHRISWDNQKSEDDMQIVFNGAEKAIKLCGSQGFNGNTGLFRDFTGVINFNNAVDLAPTTTSLSYMFSGARNFNAPLDWDTSSVTDMRGMFNGAVSFNQPVDFDTSNVTNMSAMFVGTTAFDQSVVLDIGSLSRLSSVFNGSSVERVTLNNAAEDQNVDAVNAFKNCSNLEYLEFSGLKNATIEGFSDDYFVEENGGSPIAKDADEGYAFTDNQSYKVYLQSEVQLGVPTVTLSKAGSAIKVSWTAVTDATGYQVYRADKNSGPFTKFKTTSGLVYTNAGNLVPGMPYYYKVRAYKKVGSNYTFGQFSDVKGYYAPGTLAAPAKPSLTLDKNGNGIRLNWNAQKRITGYQVFRSLSPDKPFTYLQTSTGTATKYTNLAGLTQGRPFYYKIRAYRMAKGVRAYSPFSDIEGMFAGTDEQALGAVSFSLEDNPGVSAPNVRVRWTGVNGADGYCIYRWNSAAQNWTGLKLTGPNARVYTNINGVANHKTNFYGMRTYHISGGTTYYGNIGQSKGYRVDK